MEDLKDKQGGAVNVVQASEKYEQRGKGNGRGKGRGKGKAPATGKIEYPATVLCYYVDQGKPCPLYHSPEGCPNLHPEDGTEANREKRAAQEELMKLRQEGQLIPPSKT